MLVIPRIGVFTIIYVFFAFFAFFAVRRFYFFSRRSPRLSGELFLIKRAAVRGYVLSLNSPTHIAVAPATEAGMARKFTTGIMVISSEPPPKP